MAEAVIVIVPLVPQGFAVGVADAGEYDPAWAITETSWQGADQACQDMAIEMGLPVFDGRMMDAAI